MYSPVQIPQTTVTPHQNPQLQASSSKANPTRTPRQPKSKALDDGAADLSRALIVAPTLPIANTT
ncbi:hypothetical protein FVEG_03553 [Fusarium verticillioides 7600]|uniref:Uncharacterized protein n=1 Tax=Gibberella moniliformis (strain M3125 / FGSC 7600) TaxID=334819 RepID=W7M945_GIBM7|nr:hypothetical protein FVEG_03553 [Fusarium verticillioides 7600]EWG41432.1 hypothetical protein FVEG_03553 [Fusarium verticillioides 7600]